MKYTLEQLNEMMERNGGSLYLGGCTSLTELPEGLTVGGTLYLRGCTSLTELPKGLTVGGSLDLGGCTSLTELPERLTVSGWLYLNGCTSLTELPKGLTVSGWLYLSGCTSLTELPKGLTVGGSLYLSGCTSLTELPEGLTVGGWLDLGDCTSLIELPEGLTVGGSLYLRGCTSLTELPKGLTVGDSLYLNGTTISNPTKYRRLADGDYVPEKYIYADGILTHVRKHFKKGDYDFYIGKITKHNVVSDGTYFAHCGKLSEGIKDIAFKKAKDRGEKQYKGLSIDNPIPLEEMKTMYRIITGACEAGTNNFIKSLPEVKETYTIREVVGMIEGQYGAETFKKFFGV